MNILKFDIFEKLSTNEMDNLLDKISKDGIDSLTDIEKSKLSNTDNYNIIDEIKSVIDNVYDGGVSTTELQSETSPYFKEDKQGVHLIEYFADDYVEVVIYKNDEYVDEYNLEYSELNENTLEEILKLLKNNNK